MNPAIWQIYRARKGWERVSPFDLVFGATLRWYSEKVRFIKRGDKSSRRPNARLVEVARAWVHRPRREKLAGEETITGRRLAVENWVLLRKARGVDEIASKWLSPYKVTKATSPTYGLRTADGQVKRRPVHSHRLRRFVQCESVAGAQ